jgi:hypothetical protein
MDWSERQRLSEAKDFARMLRRESDKRFSPYTRVVDYVRADIDIQAVPRAELLSHLVY